LPLILTLLKVGAGGAAEGLAAAGAELPAVLAAGDADGEAPAAGDAAVAGEAPAAGEAAGEAADGEEAGAAAVVGFGASVGLAPAVGAAGVAVPPQAARIGSAAAAMPSRRSLRRDRRPGRSGAGGTVRGSLTRHLLEKM
jgi:hypothetical protein